MNQFALLQVCIAFSGSRAARGLLYFPGGRISSTCRLLWRIPLSFSAFAFVQAVDTAGAVDRAHAGTGLGGPRVRRVRRRLGLWQDGSAGAFVYRLPDIYRQTPSGTDEDSVR